MPAAAIISPSPGANDRIWNALEKLCLRDPQLFARYYGNAAVALVSEAWLGPCYQVTSQINVVNPGGAAQSPHRDYHIGFQTAEVSARFPAHAHRLSPVLTLQGAVAHCDMPIESGPTLYLPFSQTYEPGYLAWRRPEFASISTSTTSSCRSPRATRCSSIRRCSTLPAATAPATSSASPTCCRSPRPTAARWKASTARA